MSDRAQRTAIWLFAALLIGGTALALHFVRGYRPLAGLSAPVPPLPPDVALRFEQVRVIGRSQGRPAWTLDAGRIDTTPAHTRITFAGSVSASLLDHGRVEATMRSAGATYDAVARILTVSGGIVCNVLEPQSGAARMRIVSPDLQWQVDGHMIHANGPVEATFGKDDVVTGDQMDVDLRNRNLTMKNVDATFPVQEDDSTSPLPSLPSLKP